MMTKFDETVWSKIGQDRGNRRVVLLTTRSKTEGTVDTYSTVMCVTSRQVASEVRMSQRCDGAYSTIAASRCATAASVRAQQWVRGSFVVVKPIDLLL